MDKRLEIELDRVTMLGNHPTSESVRRRNAMWLSRSIAIGSANPSL